jgi:hypothetical protein
MDPFIFAGRMLLVRFRYERQLEYDRLVKSNQLRSRLADAPSRGTVRTAYVLSFTATAIQLPLAVAIFSALLAQPGDA